MEDETLKNRILQLIISLAMILIVLSACQKKQVPLAELPSEPLTAAELLDLGERYLLDLDYEQALVQFMQVIEIEPKNPHGYTGAAKALVGLDRHKEAVSVLQSGIKQLPKNRGYLEDAAEILEKIIDESPSTPEAYIELADLYFSLGDDERAIEVLRRGLERLPDNKRIAEMYYDAIIPEYTIEQTLYQEIRADDGVLLACNEYKQPVFVGDSKRIRKMNDVFMEEIHNVNLDDFEWTVEAYESREGYVYEEAQYGRVGGYARTWEEGWRKNQYISFVAVGEWDGLGPHGGIDVWGNTFNAETGELLTIADVLRIAPENITEVLYNEYVAYQAILGNGLDRLALGLDGSSYTNYVDSVKSQCGVDAVFSFAVDGVCIYFDQYTYDYATGLSELVIPYDRDDLLRAPFAETLKYA